MSISESLTGPGDPLVGTLVAGRYEILSRLGAGGMGVVYKARQVSMERLVVLKMIHPHLAEGEAAARFHREMQATSQIRHPNTVDVYDYGSANERQLYLVMEFLEGRSLRAVLEEAGPLPPPRAVHITTQIARALSAAHKQGIVHRDLKPDNIMLVSRDDDPDFVKVLDFGIARFLDSEQVTQLTQGAAMLGTPAYMSPEQINNRSPDARSDLYSLGVVLYQMVTGVPPFRGETLTGLLVQHLQQQPPPPSSVAAVPPGLEALILRLLAKDPAQRPQSAAELVTALSTCLGGPGDRQAELGTQMVDGAGGGLSTRLLWGLGGALLLLCGLVVGGAVLVRGHRVEGERLRAELQALLAEHGDPAAPAACQSQDRAELRALARAALLLAGAAPGQARPQDAEASGVLAGIATPGAEALALRSRADLLQGRTEEAVREAEQAVALCPSLALAQDVLGNAHQRAGRQGEARAAYQKAVLLAADYGAPRLNLALLDLRRGEARAALVNLDELLRRQPGYPTAHLVRGQARLTVGQVDGAVLDLREAAKEPAGGGKAWLLLGQVQARAGQMGEAQAAFCKAAELGEAEGRRLCKR